MLYNEFVKIQFLLKGNFVTILQSVVCVRLKQAQINWYEAFAYFWLHYWWTFVGMCGLCQCLIKMIRLTSHVPLQLLFFCWKYNLCLPLFTLYNQFSVFDCNCLIKWKIWSMTTRMHLNNEHFRIWLILWLLIYFLHQLLYAKFHLFFSLFVCLVVSRISVKHFYRFQWKLLER